MAASGCHGVSCFHPVTAAQVAKVRKVAVPVEPSQTEATFAAGRRGTFPPVARQPHLKDAPLK